MRKLLNISITVFLLFSTSGVAISKHYCGEILQKIGFNAQEKSCCEGQEMPEDCCKDEVNILKSENLQVSQHDVNLKFWPVILYKIEVFVPSTIEDSFCRSSHYAYKSPPTQGQDIIIQVQSFLL